jgi:hypothetical protein
MKKTLVFALVLALSLSLAPTAFAADPTDDQKKGAGTISFQDSTTTPEIIDPPPELVDEWGIATDLNLDFGLQTVSASRHSYSSYEHARSDETKLAGVVIQNDTLQDSWVLQVSMTGFSIGQTPTMTGFELELVPHSEHTTGSAQTVNTVTLEADAAPQTIMTITPVSTVGANWKGILDVLGGSVQQTGDATAEMTWIVVNPAA